jgi:1-acyl-sn-glycerol-3-phosphate acyltransferase
MLIAHLKKIYLLPWTIWCMLVFIFFNLIFFPFLFIFISSGNAKLYRWAHYIPSIIARCSLFFWGVGVEVKGRELFDWQTQFIFVGNHRSMIDALVSGAFIYNPKKYIGKAEILNWPFLGYILRKLYIPVKRDNDESRKWSREQLIIKMKEGFSMVIFAEGKTNASTDILLPFKSGAFTTSCETQVPILPFVMYNADKIWHRSIFFIRPGKIYLDFLKPIVAPENTIEKIEEMKDYTYDLIIDKYCEMDYKLSD